MLKLSVILKLSSWWYTMKDPIFTWDKKQLSALFTVRILSSVTLQLSHIFISSLLQGLITFSLKEYVNLKKLRQRDLLAVVAAGPQYMFILVDVDAIISYISE